MTERKLKLYFPSLIPRYRHAQKWRCLKGYGEAPLLSGRSAVKIVHCRFPAKSSKAVGKRILFFSDLHYTSKDAFLASELSEAVKKFHPDILLCGGDLCTDAISIDSLSPMLQELSRQIPCCVTIPGNWERGKSWLSVEFWQQFMGKHNWHFLCNSGLEVQDWGWIYGCDDISKGYPALLEKPSETRENIFLVHRPDTVIAVDRESPLDPFSLILCGHTHGGQIRLPFWGAITVPSFYGRRLACGLYQKKDSDTRMLISTGVNHASFPLRINCRRELLLIDFE
ncbi:MAG: hypothetical protein E7048_07775 [Lentisphaerae bacterium]|nr:hypothetical protein [Lentisphaerota bacterium]